MKPKKPRPRKPRERPDLRRLAAPPPADFYRLPELERRQSADRRLPQGAGLHAAAHLSGHGGHSGNIVWRGPADRILRGQKSDRGGAVRAH